MNPSFPIEPTAECEALPSFVVEPFKSGVDGPSGTKGPFQDLEGLIIKKGLIYMGSIQHALFVLSVFFLRQKKRPSCLGRVTVPLPLLPCDSYT